MANFALTIVPPDWTIDRAPGLSHRAYEQYREQIEPGMRVIIYQAAPTNAVIGEATVIGVILPIDQWPKESLDRTPKTATGSRADYVIPLRILYQRDVTTQIPLNEVREALDDPMFPIGFEEWLILNDSAYQMLTEGWPGSAATY